MGLLHDRGSPSAQQFYFFRSPTPFRMKAVVLAVAVLFLTGRYLQPREATVGVEWASA